MLSLSLSLRSNLGFLWILFFCFGPLCDIKSPLYQLIFDNSPILIKQVCDRLDCKELGNLLFPFFYLFIYFKMLYLKFRKKMVTERISRDTSSLSPGKLVPFQATTNNFNFFLNEIFLFFLKHKWKLDSLQQYQRCSLSKSNPKRMYVEGYSFDWWASVRVIPIEGIVYCCNVNIVFDPIHYQCLLSHKILSSEFIILTILYFYQDLEPLSKVLRSYGLW